MITPQDAAIELTGLAIARAHDYDDLVAGVASATARSIGTDSVVITLNDDDAAALVAAATSGLAHRADLLQHELADGPGRAVASTGNAVLSGDVARDVRWPRWGPAAADLGLHSVLSTPLTAGGRHLGSLTAYSPERDRFGPADVQLARLCAQPATVAVLALQRQHEHDEALASRSVLGRAQGMVMERHDLDAEHALELLERHARTTGREVVEVARGLVATGELPVSDDAVAAPVGLDRPGLVAVVTDLLELSTEDLPVEVMLRRLCEAAAQVVPSDGVGVMVTEDGRNRFVHATTASAADLERIQDELRTGPCREAAETSNRVVVDTPEQMERWPRFAETARRGGIRSLAAVPLMSRGRCWGVLDLYRRDATPWTTADLAVATLMADVATAHMVTVADREESRLARIQLGYQSTHDVLTGLPNRLLLFDRLERALASSARRERCVLVLFVDLVEFKNVNDVHGHRAGDQVLREVALRLDALVNDGGTLARLGGDDLVLVLDDLAADEATGRGREVASAVHAALATPVELESGAVQVGARVGAAVSSPGMTAEELVDEADNALYEAEDRTADDGDTIEPVVPRTRVDGSAMARDLPRALERGRLAVHYQPIVSATSPYDVVAVEALLRWHDEDGRIVPARSFIDLAVRRGLMPAFGTWAVEEVCAQIATWRGELGRLAPSTVFVNLSARELNDPALPGTLAAVTRRHGLEAHQLGLEVVEESFVHAGLVHRLAELRGRGHPLAIDDFGTGYSSLSRLLDVPADVVKIDRAFVDGLPRDERRGRFVRSVVEMAGSLDVGIVAEGVETVEQRDFLADAGFDRLQGYLFGRPAPAEVLGMQLARREQVMLVQHLLSGESLVVGRASVADALMRWFQHGPDDVLRAIDDLQDALIERRSTRSMENYLGVAVTRA